MSKNIVHIDGRNLRNKAEFLTTVSKALNFPDYFGNNWDAFAECLDDLYWQNNIALIIEHANELLIDAEEDRKILFEIVDKSLFKITLVF